MNITHVPYVIKTTGAVTMFLNGEGVTVASDHPNYVKVVDALKAGKFDLIDGLVNITKAVASYTARSKKGTVTIKDGVVSYNEFPLHSTLTIRILKMMSEGFKFDHMVAFLENLLENPSKRAVTELYTFLENYGLPITDDGCFLAYKAVKQSYFDIYTGRTFKNVVGSTIEMPRNMVDDDWGKDCSQGLHCGALKYVVDYGHFHREQAVCEGGNRLIIVKVNPRDVVCVPKYEESTKMRVCKYVVMSEIKDCVTELKKIVYKSTGAEKESDDVELDDSCDGCCGGCGCSDDESSESDDYANGYVLGEQDAVDGKDFQESIHSDDSDVFKSGYADGFDDNNDDV